VRLKDAVLLGLRQAREQGQYFGLAQQRLGLAIDELLGQQDIVTKPLSGRLRDIPGVAGATELGDRRAVLVLDIGALMEELLRSHSTGAVGS
jgi:chemotaxis protein histidine kinase CheA